MAAEISDRVREITEARGLPKSEVLHGSIGVIALGYGHELARFFGVLVASRVENPDLRSGWCGTI